MAKINYVKQAQQRYTMVPVLNEDGTPKQTPVMKNGLQRKTKHGRPVFRAVTVEDRTRPLPNRKCEKCSAEITVGSPYKWVKVKRTYGGVTHVRCMSCPTWKPSELSTSKMAGVYAAQENLDDAIGSAETLDDLQTLAQDTAEAIREVAQEYEESADNMEDGFGHATSMSDELREKASDLESWADEVEQSVDGLDEFDVEAVEAEVREEDPDLDDDEVEAEVESRREEWLEEAREALSSVAQDCPV
jgi:hypothetical protein